MVWSFELTAFSMMFFDGIHRRAADFDGHLAANGRDGVARRRLDMSVATAAARAIVLEVHDGFLLFDLVVP